MCHVVSASGNRLITELGTNYNSSQTLSLPTASWQIAAPGRSEQQMNADFAWAGLSPTASFLFTNGAGLAGGTSGASALYKLTSATSPTAVTVTGLPSINAGTPAFSADGKHIAFNANGGSGNLTALTGTGTTSSDGASLGAIDFNGTSTFSNARILATPGAKGLTAPSGGSDATGKVWFPSFLPDTNDDVIFQYETYSNGRDTAGTRSQCDGNGPIACQNEGVHSELWWVPSSSNSISNRLNCANGISDTNCPSTTTGTNYLPAHAAYTPQTSFVGGATNPTYGADWNLNYEPTILPQQVGGYYWMVFTSRRMYGDVATINPFWSDPRYEYISNVATTKKLWVAAINPNPVAGHDQGYPPSISTVRKPASPETRAGALVPELVRVRGHVGGQPLHLRPRLLLWRELHSRRAAPFSADEPLHRQLFRLRRRWPSLLGGRALLRPERPLHARHLPGPAPDSVLHGRRFHPDLHVSVHGRQSSNLARLGIRDRDALRFADHLRRSNVEHGVAHLSSSVDAGTTPVFDGEPVQLPTIVSGAPVTSLAPGQDVENALLNAGQQSGTYLRVIVRLMASSDTHSAPSLSAWNHTVDFHPAQ